MVFEIAMEPVPLFATRLAVCKIPLVAEIESFALNTMLPAALVEMIGELGEAELNKILPLTEASETFAAFISEETSKSPLDDTLTDAGLEFPTDNDRAPFERFCITTAPEVFKLRAGVNVRT